MKTATVILVIILSWSRADAADGKHSSAVQHQKSPTDDVLNALDHDSFSRTKRETELEENHPLCDCKGSKRGIGYKNSCCVKTLTKRSADGYSNYGNPIVYYDIYDYDHVYDRTYYPTFDKKNLKHFKKSYKYLNGKKHKKGPPHFYHKPHVKIVKVPIHTYYAGDHYGYGTHHYGATHYNPHRRSTRSITPAYQADFGSGSYSNKNDVDEGNTKSKVAHSRQRRGVGQKKYHPYGRSGYSQYLTYVERDKYYGKEFDKQFWKNLRNYVKFKKKPYKAYLKSLPTYRTYNKVDLKHTKPTYIIPKKNVKYVSPIVFSSNHHHY